MTEGRPAAAGGGGSATRPFVMLAVLAFAEMLGMGAWFAGGALSGELRVLWDLSPGQAAWLTSAVQLGFVVGTFLAALLNLADLVPSRAFFAANAVLAAAANGALLAAPSFPVAIGTRFLVGVFLAGVYPPAMKMASTWFRQGRGFAIGIVVGALTVGKASPYLVEAVGGLGVWPVVTTTSVAALVAAAIVLIFYRDGPIVFARRPFSWGLVGEVMRGRPMRLVSVGYLGHMWELYAFWTYVGAYWAASLAARSGGPASREAVAGLAFVSIAIGLVGCLWGGRAADRLGRERVVVWSLVASGACALLSAVVFGTPLVVALPVILVWGVAVIADSAQFSALATEVAPPHAVGTALTLQTSFGFLLTMVAIQLMPALIGQLGTRWAFPVLALGPAVGVAATRSLRQLRSSSAAPAFPPPSG